MLSSLSIKQRAAIMLGLIASGPACVAIGASNGWSAGAIRESGGCSISNPRRSPSGSRN